MIDLLKKHASVRLYKDEPLSKEVVTELVQAGQHAASSNFVQAYSVIHVTDPAKRERLVELASNPKQFLSAGAVLLFCMDFKRLSIAAELNGKEIEFGYAENTLVGAVDVTLFAQNVAIAAESKGYGICYIGGVRNNPAGIAALFNLPIGVVPMYAMSIGVPAEANEVKPRLPVEAVLFENEYNADSYQETLPAYDETMKAYYAGRGSNQKEAAWTDTMADFLADPKRPHMQEFLKQQGFNLK